MKYITNLSIVEGDTPDTKAPAGYHKIGVDLNANVGGKYIYLCYKDGTIATDAITSIVFIKGSEKPPTGYTKIDKDLNKGAGGEYIYLCYIKETGAVPIVDIDVIHGKTPSIEARNGFIKISQDLNQGTGGEYIYLTYRPEFY